MVMMDASELIALTGLMLSTEIVADLFAVPSKYILTAKFVLIVGHFLHYYAKITPTNTQQL